MPRFFRFIALAILLSVIAFLIGCGASASSGTSLSSSPGSGSNPAPDYGVGIGASGQTGPAKFMYANPAGLGGPYALAIQSGGLLTQQTSGSADNNDPMTMAIDPSGSLLFQTANGYDGGTLGGLFAYVIDRSIGSLTTASGSPYLVGQSLFADIVDNSGKFLYVQGESGVYGFSIQSGGTLTPVSGSPFSAAGPPSSRDSRRPRTSWRLTSRTGICTFQPAPASRRTRWIRARASWPPSRDHRLGLVSAVPGRSQLRQITAFSMNFRLPTLESCTAMVSTHRRAG